MLTTELGREFGAEPAVGIGIASGEVFAGEICSTPAPVILSMTSLVTDDDAAPTMTSTSSPSMRSTDWLAMSVLSSPESVSM